MAGIMDALMGGKAKELEERMLASISASRDLAAELRTHRVSLDKHTAETVKLRESIDKLSACLSGWTQVAEEIKKHQGR